MNLSYAIASFTHNNSGIAVPCLWADLPLVFLLGIASALTAKANSRLR